MSVRTRPLSPFTWLFGADPSLWGHSGRAGLCLVSEATRVPGAYVESRFGLVFWPGNMRFREQQECHLQWSFRCSERFEFPRTTGVVQGFGKEWAFWELPVWGD